MATPDNLIFEPVARHMSSGNEIQLAKTTYNGIIIHERTWFPWNIFQQIRVSYLPDLIIQEKSELAEYCKKNNIFLSDKCYTDEGYFMPVCESLESAVGLVDFFKKSVA